jgi:hypothetical protein
MPPAGRPTRGSAYAYLLGLYLGDGYLVTVGPAGCERPVTYRSMRLCQEALDLLGVAWRMNRPDSLSVAHREAVAALDRHVGPKS